MNLTDYIEEMGNQVPSIKAKGLWSEDKLFEGCLEEAFELWQMHRKTYTRSRPIVASELRDELGDLLWYVTMISIRAGISLDSVMDRNVEKLKERYKGEF